MKSATRLLLFVIALAGVIAVSLTALFLQPGLAAEPMASAAVSEAITQWALIGAALSAGLSSLAAGYAVAAVGSAAIGALAEKPELFGRLLVLVGLAEGIAIYGLIVAILILNRAG